MTTGFHYDNSPVRIIMESTKTLFLFTKSDIKTILIPVTVFAVATASLKDIATYPQLVLWIWLHILQCALANQSLHPDEDAFNKPDRPIPAGRITVSQTRLLRWGSVPACLALSACYGYLVFQASAALGFFLVLYNELQMSAHWLGRNAVNGVGLACFEVGASLIAGHDRSTLDSTSKRAVIISTCIFVTTTHAQDFKDVVGDMAIGRCTMPMKFPTASRVLLLPILLTWSIFLALFWQAGPLLAGGMLLLAVLVGGRFILYKSVSNDQKSFYLYNVWLTSANAFPALIYYTM